MATEVFCWGYTAWRSQRRDGCEVSGFIDGYEFYAVKNTVDAAERAFCRAARRAWLRRKVRVACGLPARATAQISSADTYHDVRLRMILSIVLRESSNYVRRRIFAVGRWLR
jgi:hypothetical protein